MKEIGIEIEEDEEDLQQIIDIFVSQRITPMVLKTVNVEDLKESFKELKIAIGFQSQLLAAIKASKVKKNLFELFGLYINLIFSYHKNIKKFEQKHF